MLQFSRRAPANVAGALLVLAGPSIAPYADRPTPANLGAGVVTGHPGVVDLAAYPALHEASPPLLQLVQ